MLSDTAIRKAKPGDRDRKLHDRDGLYLLVKANGSRMWRLDYRLGGKRRTLAIGRYPDISLAEAREMCLSAKRQVADGIDPVASRRAAGQRRLIDSANTFEVLVDEYLERMRELGRTESTINRAVRLLKKDAGSSLSHRPIREITSAEILTLLRRIEARGKGDTAHRIRAHIGAVFRYAISTLRADSDPTAALKGALKPVVKTPRAALTDEVKIGDLMNSIDEYDGWITLTMALKFNALTFARPGEVRGARWSEIDILDEVWTIPARRMKMRRDHLVPLSRQAVVLLNRIRRLSGNCELVFPSIRSTQKPLSENAMNSALRRMGYSKEEMTSHGFRAMASTVLHERGFPSHVIEAQLAHVEPNEVKRAYNRALYWDERVNLMQKWADILDDLRRSR